MKNQCNIIPGADRMHAS